MINVPNLLLGSYVLANMMVVHERILHLSTFDFLFQCIPSGVYPVGIKPDELPHRNYPASFPSPPHFFELSKDLYFSEIPVTQAWYHAVMDENPSYMKGKFLPVVNVSWWDIKSFLIRLSAMSGESFRLPTAREWEIASAIHRNNYRSWNAWENAWFYENSANQLQPTGLKKPNVFGLYDMPGNVYEWCENVPDRSCYKGAAYNTQEPWVNPFYTIAENPNYKGNNLGFRVLWEK